MATTKIKKGDTVQIITGKSKGESGKVLRVEDGKVLIEGCKMVKKHQKATQANPKGGIENKEAMIDVSNVVLLVNGKPTKVGFKTVEDSKSKSGTRKVRFAKSTGEVID